LNERALAIREKVLGPEHPDVADTLNELAKLYIDKGEQAKAVEHLSRAVKISERNIALNLNTGSERQKLLYLVTLSNQTNDAISFHAQSMPGNVTARDLAIATVLQRKGRALDAMTDSIAALRRRADPQDLGLIDRLIAARTQLSKLVLGGPGETKPAEYQAQTKASRSATLNAT
jgi:tetratricopeptide (TPR) repeat protein